MCLFYAYVMVEVKVLLHFKRKHEYTKCKWATMLSIKGQHLLIKVML